MKVQILTLNDAPVIEKTLKSINLPINIIDLGSTDETLNICKKFKVSIFKTKEKNKSNIRNSHAEEWNLLINPGEILHCYDPPTDGNCYTCQILNKNVINKEIRIWNKNLNFQNYINEYIFDKNSKFSKTLIISENNSSKYTFDQLLEWNRANMTFSDPYYYLAMKCLEEQKYKEFLSYAESYLFREKTKIVSVVMIKYYMAIVLAGVFNDYNNAIKNIAYCLSCNLLMAEFWCLLGDIYFNLKEFKRSASFYENALLLGCKRLEDDVEYPIYLSKYADYPEEMIEKCKSVI